MLAGKACAYRHGPALAMTGKPCKGKADAREMRIRSTMSTIAPAPPELNRIEHASEGMGCRFESCRRSIRPCCLVLGRARFLSDEEIRVLSRRLSAHAEAAPGQVAVVRLLLLTGCRKSEILTLRWSDYREGHLHLPDSKSGPRTVWLSPPARKLLDGLDRSGEWVFPATRRKGPRKGHWLERFWCAVRAEAGLHGVRLHDLRHTHANIALRHGETVLTIARLLGHRNPATTLRCTHFADRTVMDAAHRRSHRPPSPPDAGIHGLGQPPCRPRVRVRPTGGASYVLLVNAGGSSRRVSLGPVSWKFVAEVRRECHVRKADPDAAGGPKRVAPLFRDFVHRFPNTVERTTDKPLSTAAPESLSLFDLWQR